MSSGMFRISPITVPAFSMRSTSLSLSAAGGEANVRGAMRSKPAARYFASSILFLPRFGIAGRRAKNQTRLFAVASKDENASGKGDDSENWRKRNGLVFLFAGLYGPNVHDLLVRRVADALIDESDHAERDQGQTEQ